MPDPFAIPDPFSRRDPLASIGKIPGLDDGGTARRQRAEHRRPLPPEQSDSFAKQALNSGTSGLSYVLGTLDKPGQAVRGVLAGKGVSSLKHLVPFSDTMGLTTEADHTSGRDITDAYGLTRKGDKGWGSWGAGLAAEIATDPLTYTTFGAKHALTGAGKVAQKAGALKGWSREALLQGFHGTESGVARRRGKTAENIAHMVNQGRRIASPAVESAAAAAGHSVVPNQALSGLVRFKAPFLPSVTLGTGKVGQKVARGLDQTGDFLRFGNPVGRAVGSMFDHKVGGAVEAITQRGWQRYGLPATEAGERAARGQNYELLSHLDPLIRGGAHNESDITNAAIALAEGTPHNFNPTLVADAQPIASHLGSARTRYMDEATKLGLPLRDASDDFAGYVHRESLKAGDARRSLQLGGRRNTNLYPVTSGSNISRQAAFRNVPGGMNRINDWFDRFAGLSSRSEIKTTADTIRRELDDDFLKGGGNILNLNPGRQARFDRQAKVLAHRIGRADPIYRSVPATPDADAIKGLPFFSPDLAATQATREAQHARTVAAARAAFGTIGDVARRGFDPTLGDVAVPTLLKRLGLTTTGGIPIGPALPGVAPAMDPIRGALVQAYRSLARKGAGPVDALVTGHRKDLARAVGQYGVSAQHAEQILKAYAGWRAPEPIKSTVAGLDSLTNAFKSLVYPIWLPSHVRNAFTAGTNNAWNGATLGDHLAQLKIMTGRGGADLSRINPALAGLSSAEQVAAMRRAQYTAAGIFGDHNAANEIAGSARRALENQATGGGPSRFTPFLRGTPSSASHGNIGLDAADLVLKQGLLGSLKATGRTALNAVRDPLAFSPHTWGSGRLSDVFAPLAIKGVNGAGKDALPAVLAGRTAGTHIENFFRGALYNSQVRKEPAPDVAANLIDKIHFNYGNMTGFEKNVMRRVVPFYTFARRNLPLQVETALSRPGVFNAQYRPFNQQSPEDKGFVPEYLRSGVALPTGPEVDGKRQYVSKLGLPGEEAFERIHFKDGLPDLKATAMDYLGQLNPLIKAPLEQLFDTQLHTQRRLSDLKPQGTASAIGGLFGEDNPQLLSQILANSPATRFISSADKLFDDRKGIGAKAANLLTGVRVTDVDTDKQRAVELRTKLEEMMRTQPHLSRYTNFYVKPDEIGNLTREEVEMMRFYSELQERAKEFAKSQRIGIKP